jgi:hypothetical protein
LPQIAAANVALEERIEKEGASAVDIEHIDDDNDDVISDGDEKGDGHGDDSGAANKGGKRVIELELGLGVFENKDGGGDAVTSVTTGDVLTSLAGESEKADGVADFISSIHGGGGVGGGDGGGNAGITVLSGDDQDVVGK